MSTVTTYPSTVSHVLGLEVCSMLPGEIFMLVSIFTEDKISLVTHTCNLSPPGWGWGATEAGRLPEYQAN